MSGTFLALVRDDDPTSVEINKFAAILAAELNPEGLLTVEDILGDDVLLQEVKFRIVAERRKAEDEALRIKQTAIADARAAVLAKRGNKIVGAEEIRRTVEAIKGAKVASPAILPKTEVVVVEEVITLDEMPKGEDLFKFWICMDWERSAAARGILCSWIKPVQVALRGHDLEPEYRQELSRRRDTIQKLIEGLNRVIQSCGKNPLEARATSDMRDEVAGRLMTDKAYRDLAFMPEPAKSPAEEKVMNEAAMAIQQAKDKVRQEIAGKIAGTKRVSLAEVVTAMAKRVVKNYWGQVATAEDMLCDAAVNKYLGAVPGTNDVEVAITYALAGGLNEETLLLEVENARMKKAQNQPKPAVVAADYGACHKVLVSKKDRGGKGKGGKKGRGK